ncbi:hypothetical protein [Pseudophaeobacter leonis]|uniref:hypothetical protein n=1 Tax=Pseudophaeobacter leonis TaxID=1144477 RepID=UPI0009F3BF32|nr:hypothetical protein [Pseudophaeobacter leonis]
MTKTEPDPQVQSTGDLLLSLQRSILRLRHEAEELQQRLAAEGDEALTAALPRLAKLESLIRDCQKVEKTLVENSTQGAPDQSGIDLATARVEIISRLDRLRSALGADETDGAAE